MKWYNFFSNFYDFSLGKVYHSGRIKAVEHLGLKPGMNVLDVACGTGANFSYLLSAEPKINLYATDFSEGMLARAQSKVQKNRWDNVQLFQADARDLSLSYINEKLGSSIPFDRIICTLGFSVLPQWEKVMDNIIGLLKEDGRISIMDVFAEKRNINSWFVEKFANADVDRQIWQRLKLGSSDFNMDYIDVNKLIVGGSLFVASGKKKN
jgi:ubiquinone/menaquinone biosynthesis C-methylase UbiE